MCNIIYNQLYFNILNYIILFKTLRKRLVYSPEILARMYFLSDGIVILQL